MVTSRKKLPLFLAFGAAVAVISVTAYGNRPCCPGSTETESGPVHLSADQIAVQKAAVLAAAGRAAMSYVAAAAQGIDATDTGLAREHLATAQRILGQLKKAVGETGDGGSKVLPIFAQVGVNQDVDVTGEMKTKLQSLTPNVVKGEHQRVIEGLETTGIDAAYTYVDMPLETTIGRVDTAIQALDSGKTNEARQAIIAVNEGLITGTFTVGVSGTTAQEPEAASS